MAEDLKTGDKVWTLTQTHFGGHRPPDKELGTVLGFVTDAGERLAVVSWPGTAQHVFRRGVHFAFELMKAEVIQPGDLVQERASSKASLDRPTLRVISEYMGNLWVVPVHAHGSPYTVRREDMVLYRKGG